MNRNGTRHFSARARCVRGSVAQAIGFAAVLASSFAVRAAGSDWSQLQGNAAHTGYVPGRYATPLEEPLWSFAAPAFEGRPGERGVAIDEQAVYATVLEGNYREGPYHVLSFDALTGAPRWQKSFTMVTNNGLSAPSITEDRLYVHRWGHSSACGGVCYSDPALIGLSLADGSHLFTTPHLGQFDSGSRPTPYGDLVFVAGGYNGGLDAYDAVTGEIERFTTLPGQTGWIPAADDEHVYVYMSYGGGQSPGPAPGRLYVLGKPGGIQSQILHPESDSRRVYTPDLQSVVLGDKNNALAVTRADSRIDGNSILVCFDLENQSILWQQVGRYTGNMAVANGVVAIPNEHNVSFYRESTGQALWHWSTQSIYETNVILTDNLAIVSNGWDTYGIDLRTHFLRWSLPYAGELALAHNLLVISNQHGIHAFQLDFVPEPATGTLSALAICFYLATQRRGRRDANLWPTGAA